MKFRFTIRDLLVLIAISSLICLACQNVPVAGSKTSTITNEGLNFPRTIPWDDGSIDSTRDGVITSTNAPNVWTFAFRRPPTPSEFALRAMICIAITMLFYAAVKAFLQRRSDAATHVLENTFLNTAQHPNLRHYPDEQHTLGHFPE